MGMLEIAEVVYGQASRGKQDRICGKGRTTEGWPSLSQKVGSRYLHLKAWQQSHVTHSSRSQVSAAATTAWKLWGQRKRQRQLGSPPSGLSSDPHRCHSPPVPELFQALPVACLSPENPTFKGSARVCLYLQRLHVSNWSCSLSMANKTSQLNGDLNENIVLFWRDPASPLCVS